MCDNGTTCKTIDYQEGIGRTVFPVNPGTHTVVIDHEVFSRKAILNFLNALKDDPVHSGLVRNELIAYAIGMYDIPVGDVFPDKKLEDLSDGMLGIIYRVHLLKEQKA